MSRNLLVTDDATTICGIMAQQPFVSHAEVDTTDPNRVLLIYTNGEHRVLDIGVSQTGGHNVPSFANWEPESAGYVKEDEYNSKCDELESAEGEIRALEDREEDVRSEAWEQAAKRALEMCEDAISAVQPLPTVEDVLDGLR